MVPSPLQAADINNGHTSLARGQRSLAKKTPVRRFGVRIGRSTLLRRRGLGSLLRFFDGQAR